MYRIPWSWTEGEEDEELNVMLHAESSTGEEFSIPLEPHPHSDSASTAILYAPLGRLSYELILSVSSGAVSASAITSGELPVVAMGCVDVRAPAPSPAPTPAPAPHHIVVETMKKASRSRSQPITTATTTPLPSARVVRRTATTAYVEFNYEYMSEAREVYVVLPGLDCVRLIRRQGGVGYFACVPHVPYGIHRYRFHVLPHGTLAPRDAPTTLLGFDPTHSGALLVTWEQTLVVRQPVIRSAVDVVKPSVIAALCAAAALVVIARIARARAHPLDDNHHHPDR